MKKAVSVVMLITNLIMMCVFNVYADDTKKCGDTAFWKFDSAERTLTIFGEGKMNDYVEWNYVILNKDETVFVPNAPWLRENLDIQTIKIEDGITYIGENAFLGLKVKNVEISSTVEYICASAFYKCSDILSVKQGDTDITMQDMYRGTTSTSVHISKIIDYKKKGYFYGKPVDLYSPDGAFIVTVGEKEMPIQKGNEWLTWEEFQETKETLNVSWFNDGIWQANCDYNDGLYYEALAVLDNVKSYGLNKLQQMKWDEIKVKIDTALRDQPDIMSRVQRIRDYISDGQYYEATDELTWLNNAYPSLAPTENSIAWDLKVEIDTGLEKLKREQAQRLASAKTLYVDVRYDFQLLDAPSDSAKETGMWVNGWSPVTSFGTQNGYDQVVTTYGATGYIKSDRLSSKPHKLTDAERREFVNRTNEIIKTNILARSIEFDSNYYCIWVGGSGHVLVQPVGMLMTRKGYNIIDFDGDFEFAPNGEIIYAVFRNSNNPKYDYLTIIDKRTVY